MISSVIRDMREKEGGEERRVVGERMEKREVEKNWQGRAGDSPGTAETMGGS